ncbi:anti-sigma F factor antagonist [Terribacillus goriensis]|uniref:anti-sigma F factor antagonist n=1 Tax=Terribacillus saccharophilus TaxID=361277 RepID=UPI0039834A91
MGLTVDYELKESILLARLNGELDHHTASELKESWQHALQQPGIKHMVLNLESLSFMDSSGLGVILGRYKELKAEGREMVVCSLTPAVDRLFQLSGLFKIIRFEENERYALETFGVVLS